MAEQDTGAGTDTGNTNADTATETQSAETSTESETTTALGSEGAEGSTTSADGKDTGSETTQEGAKAPETYEIFKIAEGVDASEETMVELTAMAKSMDMNQDQAQKMVDLYMQNVGGVEAEFQKGVSENFESLQKAWRSETSKDAIVGKTENQQTAIKAITKFGTPELKNFLNDSGMGDHPELIRFCYNIGKAISEDVLVPGEGRSTGKLYPNSDHT